MKKKIIVHASRCFITKCPKQFILKVDFANAFIETNYNAKSHLVHGDLTTSSEQGIQQGDPLGPLLFCLALQPIVLGHWDEICLR